MNNERAADVLETLMIIAMVVCSVGSLILVVASLSNAWYQNSLASYQLLWACIAFRVAAWFNDKLGGTK